MTTTNNVSLTFATEFNWKFLAGGVGHKFPRCFLQISGGAGGLEVSLAGLLALKLGVFLEPPPPPPLPPGVGDAVDLLVRLVSLTTNLHQRAVTFLHRLIPRLLHEGDGTFLVERLLADFLPARFELSDVGVVTLLRVLVGALQDRLLLQAGHHLLLIHTAQPGLRVGDAAAKVESSVGSISLLAAFPGEDETLRGRESFISSQFTVQWLLSTYQGTEN